MALMALMALMAQALSKGYNSHLGAMFKLYSNQKNNGMGLVIKCTLTNIQL